MSAVTKASILSAVERWRLPWLPSIQEICMELGHHTNYPWSVVVLVREMERSGLVTFAPTYRRGKHRVGLTDLGRAALPAVTTTAPAADTDAAAAETVEEVSRGPA